MTTPSHEIPFDITPEMVEAGRKEIAGCLTDLIDEKAADQIVIDVFSAMLAKMLETPTKFTL